MLKNGYTLMHEHIYIDLSKIKNTDDCKLDNKEQMIIELKELYKRGVRNILDLTNIGMGRNPKYVEEISKNTNINIIMSTGFYKTPFIPSYVKDYSIDKLINLMLKDITEGIDGTNIKAKIIGEIGTSKGLMTQEEEKVFISSIEVSKMTNTPISTHCTLGTYALEQLKFFKNHKFNLDKLIIGHVELSNSIDNIIKILDEGVHISFDTIGKNDYLLDKERVKMLKEIEKKGYIDRVFLSMDITRKSHLSYRGGLGYTYILDKFIPSLLEYGLQEESIDKMLRLNPINFMRS